MFGKMMGLSWSTDAVGTASACLGIRTELPQHAGDTGRSLPGQRWGIRFFKEGDVMRSGYDRKRRKARWLPIVLIVLGVLAALVLLAVGMFYHYYGLSNYEGKAAQTQLSSEDMAAAKKAAEAHVEKLNLSDSEVEQIKTENDKAIKAANVSVVDQPDVYNLLLVGVDRRDDSWNGNADSMILASINKTKKRITLMSFMRDLYADIPGYGVHKLNAACAYGGCSLLVKTLEENYKVHIDNYAWVDFQSMADVIDALGGVDLTITDAEVKVANDYITELCSITGADPQSEYLQGGGDLHCDGIQAVAFGRIRYVGNADFQRTERQRIVMEQMISKMKDLSLGDMNSFATTVLPLIHHDISVSEVLTLTAAAPTFLKYEVRESRVPFDDHYQSMQEILNPDMDYTLPEIQKELYG